MLLLWLGFAGFGLYAGLRRLQTLVGLGPPPAPPRTPDPERRVWRDDLPRREP
jgi:hypothetical protein